MPENEMSSDDQLSPRAAKLVELLKANRPETRIEVLKNLKGLQPPLKSFVAEIVKCGVDASRELREIAAAMLRKEPAPAQEPLERYAVEGTREERERAVRLLGRLLRGPAEAFLKRRLEEETSVPVREAIAAALVESSASAASALEPPPRTPLELNPPLTPALCDAVRTVVDEINADTRAHNQAFSAGPPASNHICPKKLVRSLTIDEGEELLRLLEHGGEFKHFATGTAITEGVGEWRSALLPKSLVAFLEHPDTQLIHVVRMFAALRFVQPWRGNVRIMWTWFEQFDLFRAAHSPGFTLLDLDDAIKTLGYLPNLLFNSLLDSYGGPFDWEPEASWPFYLKHQKHILEAFDPPSSSDWSAKYDAERHRESAFKVLKKFPQVPPMLVGKLWELAIATNKSDRRAAQPVVERLPDLMDRLLPLLGSGNFATRSIAAEWLGRLGDRRAVEPLRAAAKKEKQDAALDEILTALERLGEPIEEFLDRERLAVDAAKGLKKGLPEALAWFPWDTLPSVRWQDTGERIAPEVIRWLIVQNYKLKSAEAGPLLRRYGELMRPDERATLALFILGAWLNQDLQRKYTDVECRNTAKQRAAAHFQAYGAQYSGYQTQQQMEDGLFAQLQREVGSAVGEKGVLAVVGACGDESVVGPVAKYLKDWYGYRAGQCKALIAMLSGIDRPTALQYLLSISNRFRTKGIREEAEKYVQFVAERKGWTLDELADRTMPTAGFDDAGRLELSFGPRMFIASVDDELEIVLTDGDGKTLKALPAPRKDDDEAQAAAAKKAFSAAKSELKKFAAGQRTRLYEAMCTERLWPAEDWRLYFLGHPLMRVLCRRVVWNVFNPDDQLIGTFRPLEDGTLTDVDDNPVELADDGKLRIAHGCRLSPEAAAAWNKHLADYEVEVLFTQFGRETYQLPEAKRKAKSIADFKGFMLEAFKLRGIATKLGYVRGEAQDGGWFFDYKKLFPGLGLEVELAFSGNGLPEENRPVALGELSFKRKSGDGEGSRPAVAIQLADVPAVLRSECYNDVRLLAGSGTGFDPDWEKKVH